MNRDYYVASYSECFDALRRAHGDSAALELIVGGEFGRVGRLEYNLLRTLGLQASGSVVDIGCGSGRLACQLSADPGIAYFGTDILPDVLERARALSARPDWEFVQASGPPLPFSDQVADWVLFFSVFTHVANEDIYGYLREAKRLLKPGGRIVFTFLDFDVPNHWPLFDSSLADRNPRKVMTNFISQRMIDVFSRRLGLQVHQLQQGDLRWITPHRLGPDETDQGLLPFGQSVAVLGHAGPPPNRG